jgi:3-phytase
MRCHSPGAVSSAALLVLLVLLGSACGPREDAASKSVGDAGAAKGDLAPRAETDLTGITVLAERWVSSWDTTSNLDSPAVWLGAEGAWVVATAKGTHDLWVYDASTGALLKRVGRMGSGLGEFQYPNGIAIAGDLLLVVERDNHRVQALSLPAFHPLGTFGEEELTRPYGIAFFTQEDGTLQVYVTDDYGNEEDLPSGQDPTGDFTRRVKRFALGVEDGTLEVRFLGAFGEATGPGALLVVESIQVDEAQDLLLVADEHRFELEAYRLDGTYQGRTLAAGSYRFGDPEGIMLYRCGGEGYWILTDQGETRTVFHLLDRNTFEPLGSFSGKVTANTDGIWLEQRAMPGLGSGALFALHDDGGLAAFAWDEVAAALGLETGCQPRAY